LASDGFVPENNHKCAAMKPLGSWMGLDSANGRAVLTVKFAVFLDMFAVGLFVPLLPYYWKELGVRPEFLGLISSTYQISQIASGIVMGYVSDHICGRKTVLLISFVGSAISYFLAGMSYQHSIITTLVLSRVIVGLVKQTMTISRAITTSLTKKDDGQRTRMLSHIRACSTFAFMISPALGGLLSKNFGMGMPAYLAAALFLLNSAIVIVFLPDEGLLSPEEEKVKQERRLSQEVEATEARVRKNSTEGDAVPVAEAVKPKPAYKRSESTVDSIRELLSRKGLGELSAIKFAYSLAGAAMFALGTRYVADKYSLEPHHMGYLSSYQSVVSLFSQTFLIAKVNSWLGEERGLQVAFLGSLLVSVVEGFNSSIYVYVALVPFRTFATSLISQMFESLFTLICPDSEAASMLGALGLLKAVARVTGPIYGGLLLGYISPLLGYNARPVVEGFHDFAVLLLLLFVYPLDPRHARGRAKAVAEANAKNDKKEK